MSTPLELKQRYGEGTGWTYSSGKKHCAWDLLTPTGVEVHAGVSGRVEAVGDGAPNNASGHNPGSGSPSNWVLIHTTYQGRPASVLINHLSPGLSVRAGQQVAPGTYIGLSGNSGNSTGPHTHVSTQSGHVSGADRYKDLNGGCGTTIWEPSKVFAEHQGGTGPSTEEDEVVVILIQQKGTRYAAYPSAGVYRAIPDPKTENDIKNVTVQAGGRVIEWSAGKDVDNLAAFGVLVS